jgi:hypothetical protein
MICAPHRPARTASTAALAALALAVALAAAGRAADSAADRAADTGAAEPATATRRPLPVVAAGTPVDDPLRDRWNRVVLLATPRFASGDTAEVSPSIRETVSRFTFAILATVRREAGAGDPRHRLVEVGVGYGVPLAGRLTVVAPDARLPGLSLDFLGRQVLGAKHKSLAEIECVGSDDTAVAFDVPTLMFRNDAHTELVVRHLVRVDPRTGAWSTCAWLAEAADGGPVVPTNEPLRLIPGGTREDRAIHVDGSRFMLGFPTKQAFAVEDLPPGGAVPWSPPLLAAADAHAYAPPAFAQLTTAVEQAILRLPRQRSAAKPTDTTIE